MRFALAYVSALQETGHLFKISPHFFPTFACSPKKVEKRYIFGIFLNTPGVHFLVDLEETVKWSGDEEGPIIGRDILSGKLLRIGSGSGLLVD